ncbi:hypothetical protein [Lysobacter antibioticus]|uniref:hypothetical protein n=1 Tax=Lysobacter antibioticus TaxID=84531 RepID=UPI000346F95A|nr:hypothetical protein [Lysobacter antibioticus]
MGDFTKRVQNGDVPGPLRRAFTADNWSHTFGSLPNPDNQDRNTYSAGLAIHEKLEAIRAVLKLSSSDAISATTKLRAFLAIANHDFFVAREKTRIAMENFLSEREGESKEIYTLEELAGVKLSLAGGFNWLPNEVVESIVDGIELPIRVILQTKPNLTGNPQMNQVQWKEAALEFNLGITYRFAEDIWNDCLWNSYKITQMRQSKIFQPQDIDVIRAHQIGLARQASLSTAFTIMATQFQRQVLARGARLRIREVCGIERRGKRQVIKVSRHGASTEVIEELSVLRTHAAEPYYGELLEERQESLQGLTLSALVDAWTVLSRAAHVLTQSLGEKHTRIPKDDRPHTWLPDYAPTLQVEALVEAMSAAIGTRPPEGRKIVEFFTFRGEPGQEIWSQPLVPVGPGKVVPVFAAIVHPNLRRLVDVWMRQAGIDLSRRGAAFETHIRELVLEGINTSKLLSQVATCIKDDYTFKLPDGVSEQIDLVFFIGNSVFVAEAKCILEPTDTKGFAMHRRTVLGAAEQILRKAKAIEDHRTAFITDVNNFGVELTEDFKVVPFVVVSTNTHAGIPAAGVPVVDEYILGRFLRGELEDVAYQPGEPAPSKRLKTMLYSSAIEAEERAPAYLESPPQMKRFVDGMRKRIVPVYPVNKDDWSGYFITMNCVAGGVPLSLQGREDLTVSSMPTATNAKGERLATPNVP